MLARVLAISDLHCPYEHPKALDFLKQIRDRFKCDKICCLGDELDQGSFSLKYAMNPDGPSPGHELELAIESLERFYNAFPHVDVLESNHGYRIFKKAIASGLPSRVIRRYQEILNYPKGWAMVGPRLEVDGVLYVHGEGFNGSSWVHAHNRVKQSFVCGHIHSRGGVVYSQSHKRRYFSMNAGCLIDPKADAFRYAINSIEKPTLGCGVVIDGEEAYFIPMKI